MGRDRSFCGTNALISNAIARHGSGKLVGDKGVWTRLKLGNYTNATTSVTQGGDTLSVNTGIDSTDPDTVNGGADYAQYSVIKITGDTGAAGSGADSCHLPNNMIRFSWPVRDIFGRPVTKMDSPYIHMFWLDLPMAEDPASGMQDPWQSAGNTLSSNGRPDGNPDVQVVVALSELHAGEYGTLDSRSDADSDAWPFLGAGMLQDVTGGMKARVYDCQGNESGVYPTSSAVLGMRTMYGTIMNAPDRNLVLSACWLKHTAADNQIPVFSHTGYKYQHLTDDDLGDLSSTNDVYWTLNIGRTKATPTTAAQTIAFNLYVASIPMFTHGGSSDDLLWEKISPIDYVAGAGGADGS